MTLQSLAEELLRQQGNSITDTAFINVVLGWIKDALSEINLQTRWQFARSTAAFATVASQSDYDLPSGLGEIDLLRLQDPQQVIEFLHNPLILANRGYNLLDSGVPTFWWYIQQDISGSEPLLTIRLYPKPDAIYNVDRFGYLNITNLASTDTIPLQADMIMVLKDRVRTFLCEDDKDYDGADRAMQRYSNNLTAAIRRLRTAPSAQVNRTLQVTDIPRSSGGMARFDLSKY